MARTHAIEKHRAEVAERSEYQCALTHPVHGRCARSAASEDHHINLRSAGGSDDPENRVLVCPTHHQQIHGQRVPAMYRVDSDGRSFYVEDVDAQGSEYIGIVADSVPADDTDALFQRFSERGFPVYELWPDIAEAWHQRALAAHENLVSLKAEELERTWDVGENANVILTGSLHSLFGFDSFEEYAEDIDYKAATLKRYSLAVSRLHSVVSEGVTDDGEDKRALARMIKISVWHQKGRALVEMGEEKGLEFARQVRDHGVRSTSLLDSIDESDTVATEEKGPRWNVDVYASKVKFTVRPRAKTKEQAREFAERSLSQYRSLASCTVDRIVVRGEIDEGEEGEEG